MAEESATPAHPATAGRPLDILFLSNRPDPRAEAATVSEYLDAFGRFSQHRIFELSMLHHFPARLDLSRFDAVVLHYSLPIGPMVRHYLGDDLIARLKSYRGLKAVFLQDEYRNIESYWRNLDALGIDVLFSVVPDDEIAKVYPPGRLPHLRVVNVLTGYVPDRLLDYPAPPVAERPIDVGYRTRKMPYWLGRLGWEKTFIAEEFIRRAQGRGLRLDISTSEGDRLYGEDWTRFVASCRAVLGVESGASIIDFDGTLEERVNSYCARHPEASFEEVSELMLKDHEGSLRLHQISPRCFEAAALRTPMILFEGNYSGILEPGRHFFPLRKDFSNFEDALAFLADTDALQAMADRTHEEIARNPAYHYPAFIARVDGVIEEEIAARRTVPARPPRFDRAEFAREVRRSLGYSLRRFAQLRLQSLLLGAPAARRVIYGTWAVLPQGLRNRLRPVTRIISR